jgi:UDP-2,4-diacetamido-2,4,6-trideoxy-beta-L-altropyranose hydrolase
VKICLYTFGNHQIGLGHIFRCVKLGKALKKKWPASRILLAAQNKDELFVKSLDLPIKVCNERKVCSERWDLLIIDQLNVLPRKLRKLRMVSRCLVSLDDCGRGHYLTDISFNALYRCKIKRPESSMTDSKQGFEYLLLDPRVKDSKHQCRKNIRDVFLSQGGADTYGLIPKLSCEIEDWIKENRQRRLHVHLGPAFRDFKKLESICDRLKNQVKIHSKAKDMPSLMEKMDVAISSGGMTAFELVSLGIPTVIITAEKKELESASALAATGACINLGGYSPLKARAICDRLEGLKDQGRRLRLSKRGKTVIDGRGLDRMISAIELKLSMARNAKNGS